MGGEVTGDCAREVTVEATVGDNGGHALSAAQGSCSGDLQPVISQAQPVPLQRHTEYLMLLIIRSSTMLYKYYKCHFSPSKDGMLYNVQTTNFTFVGIKQDIH